MLRSKFAPLFVSTFFASAAMLASCGGDTPVDDAATDAPAETTEDVAETPAGESDQPADGNDEAAADLPPEGTSTAADARIATAVLMRLVAERSVDARAFDVRAVGGVVQLSPDDGTPQDAIDKAIEVAKTVDGVRDVLVEGVGTPTPAADPDAARVVELLEQAEQDSPLDPNGDDSVEAVIDAPAELATPPQPGEPARQQAETQPATTTPDTPAEPEPEGEQRSYTVRRGESLSIIAARQLGDGSRWTEIYRMNRDVIGPNPDGVREGMTIVLPPRR